MSALTVTLLAVVLTFAAVLAIGFAVSRKTAQARRSVALAAPAAAVAPPGPVYVPSANGAAVLPDRATEAAMPRGKITWPGMIDEGIGDLQIDERRALIARLAVVNDEWTLPILRRAVHEEDDPHMLDALVDALIARRPV